MALVAAHGRNARQMVSEPVAKPRRSALARRLRGLRDVSFLLTAWLASWAVVILVAKSIWDVL